MSQTTASIRGRVVDAITSEPIEGALMSLLLPAGASTATVRSDADGYFLFPRVEPGTWVIGGSANGFQGSSTGRRVALTVAADSRTTDIVVRLRPLGVVSGTVRDEHGHPVIGMTVNLARRVGRDRYLSPSRVVTDDRGYYRFVSQRDASYLVFTAPQDAPVPDQEFGQEGDQPRTHHLYAATYSGGVDARGAAPVTVVGGKQSPVVDFALVAGKGVRVTGRIVGSAAGHLAGAQLRLHHQDDPLPAGFASPAVVIGRDGTFEFSSVMPGAYVLDALKTGDRAAPDVTTLVRQSVVIGEQDTTDLVVPALPGIAVAGRVVYDGDSPRPAVSGATAIAITLQATRGQGAIYLPARVAEDGSFETRQAPPGWQFYLHAFSSSAWRLKSAVYRGRDLTIEPLSIDEPLTEPIVVTLTDRGPTLSGTVRDQRMLGVGDRVVAFPTDRALWVDRRTNWRSQSVMSELSGAYRFDRLPAGEYYVAVAEGYGADDWNEPELLGELAQHAGRVVLSDGRASTLDLNVTTQADATLDQSGPFVPDSAEELVDSELRGTVQDSAARPLPGATVRVRRLSDGAVWSTFSDRAGQFAFTNLGTGAFSVTAERPGYLPAAFGQAHPDLPGRPLRIAEAERRSMTLAMVKAGVISGIVRGRSGSGLWGVEVRALRIRRTSAGGVHLDASGLPRVITDDEGRYRMHGLAAGDYVVVAVPMQLLALASATTYGDRSEDDAIWSHAETYYPAGRSYAEASRIRLKAGADYEAADITMTLGRTSSVSGRVAMPDGAVLPAAARVSLTLQGDPLWDLIPMSFSRQAGTLAPAAVVFNTQPDGAFRLLNMAPGSYSVRAQVTEGDHAWWAAAEIVVGDRGLDNVVLQLAPAPYVEVTVEWRGRTTPPPTSLGIVVRPDFPGAPVEQVKLVVPRGRQSVRGAAFPGRHRLSVEQLPDGWVVESPVIVDVREQSASATIVVTDQPSRLEGTAATGATYVLVVSTERDAHFAAVDDEGRYRFEHLPPGRYRLLELGDAEAAEAAAMNADERAALAENGTTVVVERGARSYTSSTDG